MRTDRELMQQALEALENLQGLCTDADDGWVEAVTIWTPEVITALRERLAEGEHITDGQPCWCGPEVTEVDPVTGASVVVHKDAIDWEAVAADQALTIAFLRAELEGIEHRPIYVAEVTMPDPEDSPGYTEDEPTNVDCLGVPVNTPVPPPHTTPLYTSPQPSKPLTDEQITEALRTSSLYMKPSPHTPQPVWLALLMGFARAIEAAHGIN